MNGDAKSSTFQIVSVVNDDIDTFNGTFIGKHSEE